MRTASAGAAAPRARRWAACLLAAGMLLPLPLAGHPDPSSPSVILVLVDTLRRDYLGCYGFQGPISPALDGLASESVVFDRCYAPAPWTKPSVASLFTSLYPINHGVVTHPSLATSQGGRDIDKGVLAPSAITLAERLRGRGYRTAAFMANPWITPEFGFDQGFDRFETLGFEPPARDVLARAEAWLDSIPGDRPFFAYIHLMDVHGPYRGPRTHDAELGRSPTVRSDRTLTEEEWLGIPAYLRDCLWAERPEGRSVQGWRTRYASGVREADDDLGTFLDRLKGKGLLDRALLVVTADHGEELDDHGGWDHGLTFYEEILRVPLLIRPPGGASPPRRYEGLVSLLDLMPTLVEEAGGKPPRSAVGVSLVPVLAGNTLEGNRVLLAMAATSGPESVALCAADYRLFLNQETGAAHLFDLSTDPLERDDLAPAQPDLTRRLVAALRKRMKAARRAGLFEPPAKGPSQETKDLLRSLGYAN